MKDEVWPFELSTKKAIQAVAVLLRHASPERKRDNYTRVLKLLYLAEKRCLKERGRPLLGDRIVAMRNGPVLSAVYDLIQNRHFASSDWNAFIVQDRFDIELLCDPGNDQLSPFEIKLLETVADEHADQDQWQLIDLCHELPEWLAYEPKKDGPKSVLIPIDAILDDAAPACGKDHVLAWAKQQRALNELFPQAR